MKTVRILTCGIILILAVFFPNVTAENDSMKIFLTIDRDEVFSGGDTGKVTMHVFDKGEYIEPDDIPNCLIESGDFNDDTERDIKLEEKSTGIYKGDFKIYTSDVDDFERMTIKGDATYGKSDEDDTEYNMDDDSQTINLGSSDEAEAEVKVTIIYTPTSVFPGDSFTLRIKVEQGDVLKNADELDINYEIEDDEYDLPYDKVSTGIYEAVLEVPNNIKESCEIDMEAKATIDEMYDRDFQSVDIDFFSVWYNKGPIGLTICTFDVYVADANGKAVSDADIKLNWDVGRRSLENEVTKLTDSNGKASFDMTYEEDTYNLDIEGKVLEDGKTQLFSGEIELKEDSTGESEWDEPHNYELDVVLKNRFLTGKSPYTMECRAFMNGQRISEKEVYYYLYTDLDVIANGAVTTDIDGEFTLKFSHSPSTSSDIIWAYFETENGDFDGWSWSERDNSLDGKEYADEREIILIDSREKVEDMKFDDPSIKLSVDKLEIGGLTDVTVTGIPEDFLPLVLWLPISIKDIWDIEDLEEWGETFEWRQWGGSGLMIQENSFSNGKVTCKLMIPEFLPSGKYTVIAGYIDDSYIYDPDVSLEDAYHINNVILEPGKSGTSIGTAGTTESSFFGDNIVMLSAGILLLLIVIIVIVLMVKRKKGKTETYESEPDERFQKIDSDDADGDQMDHYYPPPYESDTGHPGTNYPEHRENIPRPPIQHSHGSQPDQYPQHPRTGRFPPPPY